MFFKTMVVLSVSLALVGCQSMMAPQIGMTKTQWFHRTLVADLVSAEGNEEVYRSGDTFYYFKDGKLDRIDQGQSRQQRYQVEVIHRSDENKGQVLQ